MPAHRTGHVDADLEADPEAPHAPYPRKLPSTRPRDWDSRYPCPLCRTGKRRKNDKRRVLLPALSMRRHFEQKHPMVPTNDYFCSIEPCDPHRPYSRKEALMVHIRTKHSGKPSQDLGSTKSGKPCTVLGDTFMTTAVKRFESDQIAAKQPTTQTTSQSGNLPADNTISNLSTLSPSGHPLTIVVGPVPSHEVGTAPLHDVRFDGFGVFDLLGTVGDMADLAEGWDALIAAVGAEELQAEGNIHN